MRLSLRKSTTMPKWSESFLSAWQLSIGRTELAFNPCRQIWSILGLPLKLNSVTDVGIASDPRADFSRFWSFPDLSRSVYMLIKITA